MTKIALPLTAEARALLGAATVKATTNSTADVAHATFFRS